MIISMQDRVGAILRNSHMMALHGSSPQTLNKPLLGTPVVPFYPFSLGGLIKTEQQEKGCPYYLGFTGEPSLNQAYEGSCRANLPWPLSVP